MFELLDISSSVEEILQKALEGSRISPEEGQTLIRATGDDILAVGMTANRLRKDRVGDRVSYIKNRNINFTNVCEGSCRFCAFRRGPKAEDAYTLSIEEIKNRVREASSMGASEICLQGGLNPDLDIDYYTSLLDGVREHGLHSHAFSPMEILYVAEGAGNGVKETLRTLKDHGLGSIPGTAAEILLDSVREEICPEKLDSGEWVDVVKTAHKMGLPTTATMLYGHVEDPVDRIAHMEIIRDIQDETGGFTELVPLSFIHSKTPMFKSGASKPGATGMEDALVYAVARIYLDNFDNIQASWIKLGRKFAQFMLIFGANDLGGTLIEESISLSAGRDATMITEDELVGMIQGAGLEAYQRDTLYNRL